ncbi:MAG TPA: NADH-ubiquinone oxidoreductase-F iron-sulfur binding region domain-containing protein [Acidimicrobiales bacterium]|nr:NADH-ubiquinone oxidoreductase-F iron-sulfur binding region domain-containing protein [Acidimicrobiales bacterium]
MTESTITGAAHGTSKLLRVAAAPGIVPRLLREQTGREDLSEYLATGGYAPSPDLSALLQAVEASGLRGRGGAAFPFTRKVAAVRASRTAPVVLANGEEGEPASVKDRWLMRTRPHLVLDGVRLAVQLVGASHAVVYLSDEESERSIWQALEERPVDGYSVSVHRVEPTYIAGEETAAVRAVNGGPAKPTDKPPRPFEVGVGGQPTLVSNVETLANLPFLAARGVDEFRTYGTDGAPGTFLLTLGGAVTTPGLYEVALGTPLRDAVDQLGGNRGVIAGTLMGGYFAGLIGPRAEQLTLDYDSLSQAGSGLGCGAVSILGGDHCPVAVAADVMAYFGRENAGQCGSCFNGTAAMAGVLASLREGSADRTDVERLRRWGEVLPGRGACATLDGAANLARSLLLEFPDQVEGHLGTTCDVCGGAPQLKPFAMTMEPEGSRR